MTPARASSIVKGIIVDLDNALETKGVEQQSALVSAVMLGVRLFGGMAINMARIASALEKIERKTEDRNVEIPEAPHGDA